MSRPSAPMRCLLDKNVVRYAIAGLRYGPLRLLSSLEADALSFWRAAEEQDVALFIGHATHQVLRRLSNFEEVRTFRDSVSVLLPTRYHTRWARRIRETTGLTREDTAQIALASFGSDEQGSILGTHLLITCDQPAISGYRNHLPTLGRRLRAMTAQLRPPFDQATLPRLATPEEVLREWVE